MKYKRIMLITFLLLAVLTIGAVSAADDVASDDLAVEDIDEVSVDASQDDLDEDSGDVLVSSDEETVGDDDGYNITFYEGAYDQNDDEDDTHVVDIIVPEEIDEFSVVAKVGGNEILDYDQDDLEEDEGIYYLIPCDFEDLDAGTYDITVTCYVDNVEVASQTGTLTFKSENNGEVDYQINVEDEFDVNDENAVIFSLVCPDEATGEFFIEVYRHMGEAKLINTYERQIDDDDYDNRIYFTVGQLNITKTGEYSFSVYHLEDDYDEPEEDTQIDSFGSKAIDSREFRIVDSWDEADVNALAYNIPVFGLYCPDGHEGIVVVTVRLDGDVVSTTSKNVNEKNGEDRIYWYISELNLTFIDSKYSINVNVNEGEFQDTWNIWFNNPVRLSDSYINSSQGMTEVVTVDVPSEIDEGRIIIEADGAVIFNKTLNEFEHAENTSDCYYWFHPSYGHGGGDVRFKVYFIENGIIPDIEPKTYNMTASLVLDKESFVSTGDITIRIANVVEKDGIAIELLETPDEYGAFAFISAPEDADGKIIITSDEGILFEEDFADWASGDTVYLRTDNLHVDKSGVYEITVAYWDGDEMIVNNTATYYLYAEEGEEDESPLYINDGLITTKDIVGLEVDEEVTSGRLVVLDMDTGDVYFNKTLTDMEYNRDWMEYKFRPYEGYYIFKQDLNIDVSGKYNILALYLSDENELIYSENAIVYIDFDCYVNGDEVDISDNDTVLISFYVLDMYDEGTIVVGNMSYGENEWDDELVELFTIEISSEDIGTIINLTRADLKLASGSYDIDVRFYSKDSQDEGDYENIFEGRKIIIVDNTQFRVKIDEGVSIFAEGDVFFVYCPQWSANTNITIKVNDDYYSFDHFITADEAGDYIGFGLDDLNISTVDDFSFDVVDENGEKLIETYYYEFENPFEFVDDCIIDDEEESSIVQLRTPEKFTDGRIVLADDEGNELFNKSLSEMEQLVFGWDKGFIRYEIKYDDLNAPLELGEHELTAFYVGDKTVISTDKVIFAKRNIVEKDNVTIEFYDYYGHDLSDDEDCFAKVTSPSDDGHVMVFIGDWNEDYQLDEDDGEYYAYISAYDVEVDPGTYLVTVVYYDDNEEEVLRSSANITFYNDDEDEEEYIFMTTDNINPHFDINTEYNVTGKVIIKKGDDVINEVDLDEIAEFSDEDGRWHHDVNVDWYDLEEGNHKITVIFQSVSGSVIEYKDFDIVIENWDENQPPEIFIMYSNDDNDVEYALDSTNMVHIYPNSDDSDFSDIRITVMIEGEVYLNATLAELKLEAEVNGEGQTFYTVGPADFTKEIAPGHYENVIAYYDSDNYHVNSADGDMPTYVDIVEGGDEAKYIFMVSENVNPYFDINTETNVTGKVTIKTDGVGGNCVCDWNLSEIAEYEDHDDRWHHIIHIDSDNLDEGNYTITVVYEDEEENILEYKDFDIVIENSGPECDVDIFAYRNEFTNPIFEINSAENVSGNVLATIDGAEVFSSDLEDMENHIAHDGMFIHSFNFADLRLNGEMLAAGNYNIVINYAGPSGSVSRQFDFTVVNNAVSPDLDIVVGNVEEGNPVVINITAEPSFVGDLVVVINRTTVNVHVENGFGTNSTSLTAGSYLAEVTYTSTQSYNIPLYYDKTAEEYVYSPGFTSDSANVTFTVKSVDVPPVSEPVDPELTINHVDGVVEGTDVPISIRALDNFTGSVKVLVGDKEVGSTVVSAGSGSFTILAGNLTVGSNTVYVTSEANENFTASEANVTFTVRAKVVPVNPELAIAPVGNVEEGAHVTISISALANFTGSVKVSVGSVDVGITDVNAGKGSYTIAAQNLAVGSNTVYVTSEASENFTAGEANVTFTVKAKLVPVSPGLRIDDVGEVVEGSDVSISIHALDNFTGSVKVLVGSKEVGSTVVSAGSGSFTILAGNFTVGENTVYVTSEASENFTAGEANVTFTVKAKLVPVSPGLRIDDVGEVVGGSDVSISIHALDNFTGSVKVLVGDKEVGSTVVSAGSGSFTILAANLTVGSNTVYVTSEASENFTAGEANVTFTVKSKEIPSGPVDPNLTVSVDDIREGTDAVIVITTNSAFSGIVKVQIEAIDYNVSVTNGSGSRSVSGLAVGNHTAVATFEATETFNASIKNATFKVNKAIIVDPDTAISTDSNGSASKNPVYSIKLGPEAKGTFSVKIDEKEYSRELENGAATIEVTGLATGTYEAEISYSGDSVYAPITKTLNTTVKGDPVATVIKAATVTTTYGTSKNIVVTLTDANGNALSGKEVTIALNGASKTLTTDDKGQVSYAIGTKLAPKAYDATITFAGDDSYVKSTGSVKVTVNKAKPVLTAKKNKSFKLKKPKKYTVTLKTDKKKAMKKVKVTITGKFKGKKIKITKKTNKKGKATFNLKKLNKKGKFKATVKFAGNQYYKPVTKKAKITVK